MASYIQWKPFRKAGKCVIHSRKILIKIFVHVDLLFSFSARKTGLSFIKNSSALSNIRMMRHSCTKGNKNSPHVSISCISSIFSWLFLSCFSNEIMNNYLCLSPTQILINLVFSLFVSENLFICSNILHETCTTKIKVNYWAHLHIWLDDKNNDNNLKFIIISNNNLKLYIDSVYSNIFLKC